MSKHGKSIKASIVNNNSIESYINATTLDQIKTLYNKVGKDDEFEFIFFSKKDGNKMGYENYIKVLEYITYLGKTKNLKIESQTMLDIAYSPPNQEKTETFRITVNNIFVINKLMEMLHQRKNHVIFSVIIGMADKYKDISLMKKTRDSDKIVDIDDFDMRLKVSKEEPLSKRELDELSKLSETERNYITFRYKQRTTLYVYDEKGDIVKIDLTSTKMSNNINIIERKASSYELEVEANIKNKIDLLPIIFKEMTTLLKIIQQSNYIVSRTVENEVLENYYNLLGSKKKRTLAGRKPESLEIQHVVDKLPNKYAVSDKADGERYFLIIYKGQVYLISNNLQVKNTGITIPNNKYDNSILDGEYIFIKNKNKHVFLAFDCLYLANTDIRPINNFIERLDKADELINNVFIMDKQKGYQMKYYEGDFKPDDILNHYEQEINNYMKALNHDINVTLPYPLIRRKLFIPVLGGQPNEIFKYSELLWRKYVLDAKTGCPYILDGLIFHPMDQKYVIGTETRFVEYKWKPPEKNSIDFYIMFERDRDTNKVLELYDNTLDEFEDNKPYLIVHLYVGKMSRTGEQPVLFQSDIGKHLAYLFLDENGVVRDMEGNAIQDKTVVEFYYNNDPDIPDKLRWVPMRTRYDKTEIVRQFNKGYGNYVDIANKVWRSIENPFLMSDIKILANDDLFMKHLAIIRGKIGHSIILSEQQENKYYQIKNNLAKEMRQYQNWIKSLLFYTYYSKRYADGHHFNFLDIAVGKGGDLLKYYYAEANFVIGVDVDNTALTSPIDGAISRYNKFRRGKPRFPLMNFIHADATAILTYEEQQKVIGLMSDQNKMLLQRFLPDDPVKRMIYDRINCQFAFHFFLRDKVAFTNILENIKTCLKPGGQMILSVFDADKIINLLKDKNQHTGYYTNRDGEEKVLFEIVKNYDDEAVKKIKTDGIGHAIDVHIGIAQQEGNYYTEYLVDKDFLTKELLDKCDLVLTETDLFENQYHIHRDFLTKYYQSESSDQTKGFFSKVNMFYTVENSENEAARFLSSLYRYFIFTRKYDKDLINKTKGYTNIGNVKLQVYEK